MKSTATPSSAQPGAGWKTETLALLALLAVVTLIAWPGMFSSLMLDDFSQRTYVAYFRGWGDCFGTDVFGLFRPVKNLIFYGLGGVSLGVWHLLNLGVYLTAVVAVYVLLRRLLAARGWAFLGTAVWATCPTQACATVWMSCVNISLAVALACACLWFHDRSREDARPNSWWVFGAACGMFLAQCSYESVVVLPALCVLVDALRGRSLLTRDALLRYGIYAILTLGYLWLRAHAGAIYGEQPRNAGFAPDLQRWQLSVSAPWLLWRHFSMWLMPAGRIESLSTYLWGISATPAELAAAWLWLLGMAGLIVWLRKREPWIAFGLLWFLGASFPSSNFIPIWAGPIEDYYLIVPGIGLAIALLGCARLVLTWMHADQDQHLAQRQLAGRAILGVGLFWRALGLPLFWYQASLWTHPLDLYLTIDLTRPGQIQAQATAASKLLDMGQLDQAEELAQKSYALGPWFSVSTLTLGRIALSRQNYDEALRYFDETLKLLPSRSLLQDLTRLYQAQALLARPATRHRTRDALLPILGNPRSQSHLEAVNLLVDFYLAENQRPEARKALVSGLKAHPGEPGLSARLAAIPATP